MIRVPGIRRYRSKGKWYCYHRASNTRLKEPFGSAAFFRELEEIEARWRRGASGEAKPGTLGAAIESYKASELFRQLAPRTRSDYQKVFDYLGTKTPSGNRLSDRPLDKITPASIAKLRDKTLAKRKFSFANYMLSVLGSVFDHAREYDMIETNPAKGIKRARRPKGLRKVNRPWTDEERPTVLDAAPQYLKVAIALAMFTGMREGDVIRLPRNARDQDGWLRWSSRKRDVEAEWPVHSRLALILDECAPDATTMCVHSKGRPWKSENSFRSAFFKLIAKLEDEGKVKPGLTFHGLRHTVGALLAEDGCSDKDIAVALGQKSTRMASHYSAGARRRKRMRASVVDFDPLKGKGDPRQMKLALDDGEGGSG